MDTYTILNFLFLKMLYLPVPIFILYVCRHWSWVKSLSVWKKIYLVFLFFYFLLTMLMVSLVGYGDGSFNFDTIIFYAIVIDSVWLFEICFGLYVISTYFASKTTLHFRIHKLFRILNIFSRAIFIVLSVISVFVVMLYVLFLLGLS